MTAGDFATIWAMRVAFFPINSSTISLILLEMRIYVVNRDTATTAHASKMILLSRDRGLFPAA